MNLLEKINTVWRQLGVVQRAMLIAMFLTVAMLAVILIQWARRPDMRLLYQNLGPEEAAKITDNISEKGIKYQLRAGGTSVYAPQEHIYQLRLDMAKDGLPSGSQGGYRIFDKDKVGASPFVQNVNLKRALQDELAKSIQMIDGISFVRVHIVTVDQGLFKSNEGKTTASVVLRLKPGFRLGSATVAAIAHLVSGSVENLKSKHVTVIDSQGQLLSGKSDQMTASGAGTVADYKERVEQSLARKVEDMLTTVLGPGRATVKVSADIDMTSTNVVTETYDPSKKAPKKEEIKSNSESSGVKEGEAASAANTKKGETIVTEYLNSKTVEQRVDLPGEIKSLSVAAFVDLYPADANEVQAGGETALIMPLSDIEQIIRNALGLKETDSLKVVHARFYRPAELLVEDEAVSSWPRYMAIVRHGSLGVMAICALLVLKVLGAARSKAAQATTAQLTGTEGAAGLLPGAPEGGDTALMRKQIANTLQSDPVKVKQLFNRWLEEG